MKVNITISKHDPSALVVAESRGNKEADFLFSLMRLFKALEISYSHSYTRLSKDRQKVSLVFKNDKIIELVEKLKKYGLIEKC